MRLDCVICGEVCGCHQGSRLVEVVSMLESVVQSGGRCVSLIFG